MQEILRDALLDSVKLVPFLFLTYLAMEYLEHKAGEKSAALVRRAGKCGPLLGGILGAAPQCGFSVAASGLYAGRVITLGTLLAIYLSTSDEMLPIMLSKKQPIGLIVSVLLVKVAIGVAAGFIIDFVMRRSSRGMGSARAGRKCAPCAGKNSDGGHYEERQKEDGIFRSALKHTVQITIFIFLISLALGAAFDLVGENVLADLIWNRSVLGPVLASLIGLIPNCAASVAITELYLSGVIPIGTMLSGLLTGAGAGVLVLFRVNKNTPQNLKILSLLYGIGVFAGIVINLWM